MLYVINACELCSLRSVGYTPPALSYLLLFWP
jgi:hypothetical protein